MNAVEKKPFPESVVSQRITLKRHQETLAPEMFLYVDQDRERLRKFLPWVDSTRTVEDELSYIRMTREKWVACELFDYGIFRNSDGLYLGNVGVFGLSWENRRCEVGYWILGLFEGQGFTSEAVAALEQVIFEAGFQRIEIRCASGNSRSANVPRRAGYRLDAVLTNQPFGNGLYRDTLVFAKELQKT